MDCTSILIVGSFYNEVHSWDFGSVSGRSSMGFL